MQVEKGKTYVGVVEDNQDPKKIGRVKVRVLDIFDNTPIANIPWANPWKDLNGEDFRVPEKGKVVTVVFENADVNSPEFIFSDHYNVNLEKKLTQLSDTDYTSMKSVFFDHKTQVYVNDTEGLKLDHKFNLINIKEKTIDVALKDNFGKINLGTANSTQRAILGDNFMKWMDKFLDILVGQGGGAFIGNLGAPVIPSPALIGAIQAYQNLRDPKFLSKNVYLVDNEKVDKLDRIAEGQKGDTWQSTVKDNQMTTKEPVPFTPTEGTSNTTFDQPPADQPVAATQSSGQTPQTNSATASQPAKPVEDPDINIIKQILNSKKYKLYEESGHLNIVAIRNQCINPGDKYSDQFVDDLYVMYTKDDKSWNLKHYKFSTVPGLEFTVTDSWLTEKNLKSVSPWDTSNGKKIYLKEYANLVGKVNGDSRYQDGLPILAPSQYVDLYYVGTYRGEKALLCYEGAKQLVWRDSDTDKVDEFHPTNLNGPEILTHTSLLDNGLKVHRGYPGGKNVGNWSEGSSVFSNSQDLNDFFGLCEQHAKKYENKFTFTLATKTDWDSATSLIESQKSPSLINATQSEASQFATQSTSPGPNVSGTQSSTTGTSSTTGSTQSSPTDIVGATTQPNQYILGVLNASAVAKSINGQIMIMKSGTTATVTGLVSGFPDGGSIGPISSTGDINSTNDVLANDMIITLENNITSKYNTLLKLVIVDKK